MNNLTTKFFFLLFLSLSSSITAQSETTPFFTYKDLVSLDEDRIIRDADKYLLEEPETITSIPAVRSAGGIHDFYSEGDYWWPDSTHPDGPYIRKDGLTNPDNFTAHRNVMRRLSIQAAALTAAFKITGDKKYAEHAVKHILAWFADEKTKMNPHMLYAQAIKGITTGRGIGIIDTIHLVEVVQAIIVLDKYGIFDPEDLKKIKEWFSNYSDWLMNHQYGIDERDNGNNHSTCWNMQVAAYAKLIGDTNKIEFCKKHFKEILLPDQMAEDGSFPKELERTKPYGYSLFNLDAMTMIARLLSIPDDNLWEFKTSCGKNIKHALNFMYPYIKEKDKWPYPIDVMYFDQWPVRHPSLLFAGIAYKNEEYISLWKTLNPSPVEDEVLRNFFIRQPVLWID